MQEKSKLFQSPAYYKRNARTCSKFSREKPTNRKFFLQNFIYVNRALHLDIILFKN